MTTSGSTDNLLTAEQLIQAAVEELGYVAAGEKATGNDVTLGMRQLTWMLKSLSARGVNLWREQDVTVTMPAGLASITLPQSVDNVLSARTQVTQGYQRPLFRYERADYLSIPNKATPGFPTIYSIDRLRDAAVLYVWPVPAVDTPILLNVARVIEDVTTPEQTIDVPQKWTEAMYCALAARMAGPLGVTRADPAAMQRVEARAAAFEQLLLDEDRPQSYYMGTELYA